MAAPHIQIQTDPPPNAQTPLLSSNQNHNHNHTHNHHHHHQQQQQQQQNQIPETDLDRTLQKLGTFSMFLGFNQSSALSFVLSWTAFVLIGVLAPVVILELPNCPGCEKVQIKDFELDIVASQACLAAVSLICMSHNLRKYGIRRFLFVDRYSGHMARLHYQYIQQIKDSLRLLIWWSLPCFILKAAREVICIMFRIFLVLYFLVVTASQFMTLFQTTGYSGIITFINGGDFAVSSIVQVVGIILCLHAATKISHRAQNIASIASRWHALATCNSADSYQLRVSNSVGNFEASSPLNSVYTNYSESDLESLDSVTLSSNTQLAPYMSSYHRRQAFVMYLQTNPGGITIFGWTVDRGLLNTIFFIELTLVTFVLGKTIVLSSK